MDGTNHILFALTDLNLQQDSSNDSRELMLDAQDLRILSGGTHFKLTNIGKAEARFIVLEF